MTTWTITLLFRPPGPPGTPKPPKPYLWNYPPQTPSVIYFWNPWVQTYTLLHSDHHLIRMVQWPDTPAVRFLALQNFFVINHSHKKVSPPGDSFLNTCWAGGSTQQLPSTHSSVSCLQLTHRHAALTLHSIFEFLLQMELLDFNILLYYIATLQPAHKATENTMEIL